MKDQEKTVFSRFAAAGLMLALLVTPGLKAELPSSLMGLNLGEVVELKGEITYSFEGDKFRQVKDCYPIDSGARYRTGDNSKLIFMTSGGEKVFLGPNTELLVSPVEEEKGTLELLVGWVRMHVQAGRANQVSVRTANATAAVKGTDFEVKAGAATEILVYSSHNGKGVDMADKKSGQIMKVEPGKVGKVDEKGISVRIMTADELARGREGAQVTENPLKYDYPYLRGASIRAGQLGVSR